MAKLTEAQLNVKKGAMNIILKEVWDEHAQVWMNKRQLYALDAAVKKAFKYDATKNACVN